MSRATAYRLRQRMRAGGEEAVHDRRQGHAIKVRGAVRTWLEGYYQQHPHATGKAVQALLEEQSGVRVSVTHLNRLRAALLGATRAGEKSARYVAGWGRRPPVAGSSPGDVPAPNPGGGPAHPGGCSYAAPAGAGTVRTRRHSLLTLLFLGVVGLHRPWDLRGYAQEGLARLSTRCRAYGYRTIERFLSQVAQAGGAESFTDALARWTNRLCKPAAEENQPCLSTHYLDGHRSLMGAISSSRWEPSAVTCLVHTNNRWPEPCW